MMQKTFANNAKIILAPDENVIGLAAGGSWLTNQLDEFSDLDLVLVTKEKISGDKSKMVAYAKQLGHFLSGFTGEHVGEPRVLICLYDNPLLHVDIKFLTLEELHPRVETPVLLLDKGGVIQSFLDKTSAAFPYPGYQWIEDRFWIWVHYTLLKIGRGEYMETLDCFGFLRANVFGPLFHIKNGNLPRGVRRAETELLTDDFSNLQSLIPDYNKKAMLESLRNAVAVYRQLRTTLFDDSIHLQNETEKRVLLYFDEIEKQE